MASFSERELLTRLYQALTTDGSGNVAFRFTAGSYSADSINDTHIDWGTGANQVSGVDIPLADAGGYFSTDNVEAALQQIGAALAASGAPTDATYITQVPNGSLSGEQALSTLATGILKNANGTGVLSIATEGTDYWKPGGTDVAVADGGTGASNAADARTNLGLVIGTNVQAYDAELAALAGLTSAADRVPYFTGSGTAALATFTSFGRSLVDDADASAARTTLELGTIATQAANSVNITGGSITGITDLAVADGGTGVSTLTGIVKGNGTSAFSAAVQGTDYWAPGGTDVALADGGTGASTASGARSNLGAAASGSNSDITALTGIAAQAGVVLNPFNTGAGQTSELRFLELAAQGSNYVGFKAPDQIDNTRIWTLPNADGSAGQFLKTDGSGVLSWGSAGLSTSDKTANYTVLTSDSGKVFTNNGATGFVTFTLPAAAAGYEYTFIVADAYGVIVAPAGDDTICYNGSTFTLGVGSAGTYQVLKIVSISATEWVVTSVIGGWNFSQFGYVGGGNTGSDVATIDKFTVATTPTCAVHSATLDTARARVGGVYGYFNGYFGGGDIGGTDSAIIGKFNFGAETEASLAATLDNAREQQTRSFSNANTKGYFAGGGVTTSSAQVDYMNFADDTSADLGTDLAAARQAAAVVEDIPNAMGYFMGGNATSIYKMNYGTEGFSTLSATLPASRLSQLPCFSSTKGYACGGNGGPIATVQALTYSGETVAQLGNSLPAAREDGHGISSTLSGYVGAAQSGQAWFALLFSAETWTTLSAQLSSARGYPGSIQTPCR